MGFLFLLIGGYLAIRTSPVQTWLAQQLAGHLSERVGVRIGIQKLDLEWLRTVSVEGVHIEDQHGDTLLHAGALKGRVGNFALFDRELHFDEVELHRPHVELKRYPGDTALSHKFLLEKLSSDDTGGVGWDLRTEGVEVRDGTFEFHDPQGQKETGGHVNFRDLRLEGIQVDLRGMAIEDDSLGGRLEDLAFLEKRSGFTLDSLRGDVSYSKKGILMDSLFLRTPGSRIAGDIRFTYKDPKDLQDWVQQVDMYADLERSRLTSEDLAYFVDPLRGMDQTIELGGKVRGTVSELRLKDFLIEWTPDTYFKGDIELSGLPNLPGTFMTIEASRLSARKSDLEHLPLPPFQEDRTLSLPTQLERLGNISFSGRLTGFMNDLVAYGTLNSDLGQLRTDLEFSRDTNSGRFAYDGRFQASGFDVGAYYRIPNMGRIDAKMEVKGSGVGIEHIHTKLKGRIERFRYRHYSYSGVEVEGTLHNRHFVGSMRSDDPNFNFAFNGSLDLRHKVPSYSFTMDIKELRPGVLNWVDQDSSVSLTSRLEFEGEGADLSELKGELGAYGTMYRESGLRYELGDIELTAKKLEGGRSLKLISSPLVASIKGKYDLPRLADHFTVQLQKVLPALFKNKRGPDSLATEQDFQFDVKLLEAPPLTGLILPEWDLEENTVISGSFDSKADAFHLNAFAPSLGYKGRRMSELDLNVHRRKDVLETELLGDTLYLNDSLYFNHFHFIGKALKNNLQLQTQWTGGHPKTQGKMESVFQAKDPQTFEFEVLSSAFTIGGKEWHIAPDGKLHIDGSSYRFKGFRFGDGSRSVTVEGGVSKDPDEELKVSFKDFQLSVLAPFLPDKLSPKGVVNGKAVARDLYGAPLFKSDIGVDSARMAGHKLGKLELSSRWVDQEGLLKIKASLEKDDHKTLTVNGSYAPKKKKKGLNMDIVTDGLSIALLNGVIDGGISGIDGRISGPLHLKGSLAKPVLTGDVMAKDVRIHVDALNVTYGFDQERITFYEDMIGFDHIPFYYMDPKSDDPVKGTGRATGTLVHDHFKSWNFNIFLEVEKMLAMNLDKKMNELYYGTAYGTGDVEISGYSGKLSINVDARTEKETDLKLPLGGSEEVSMENFVSFEDRDASTEEKGITQAELEGVEMNLDLKVTPDALISIIFDEKIGDVMKGRGSGNIKMEVNTNGKFNMYGDFQVYEGDYLFTMKNIINKRFSIQKGGTIEWFGDPYNANINLDAVYELRTSVYPLMHGMEDQEAYRERVPVELVMNLSKELMNPDISFDIRLPTLEENDRAIAMSRIKSMNKQAFSLLVLKRFINEQGQGTADGSQGGPNVGSNTSTELLSNQLSNWLSSISEQFDLGVKYRPGDEVTDEELAVALSTQLFNERVSFSGNLGVTSSSEASQQQGRSQNSLVGDFSIKYDITPDGKFRLKVFNESNDDRISQFKRSEYTQGVGLFYQEEFDSARELFQQVGELFRRKERKKGKGKEEEEERPEGAG